MTASAAIRTKNTVLRYAGSPTMKLEESHTIKIGGTSVSAVDVTHLESASKEFVAGLKDSGVVDWAANFTNGAGQQQMRSDFNLGTTSLFAIDIPSTPPLTISFSGFFTKYDGPEANVDGKLEISGTIKITGDLTIA